jgi:hypothetical protein
MSDVPSSSGSRFDVQLFIVHPTLSPGEISAELGLAASHSHCVGQQRVTPKGTLLVGNYPDTRWRFSERYETDGQWFAAKITVLVERLVPHRDFLRRLAATGGRSDIIVQFLGDGYFGDSIPRSTLAKLIDLELDLSIECFVVPQSDS